MLQHPHFSCLALHFFVHPDGHEEWMGSLPSHHHHHHQGC
jgi:hypothetical protein